MSGRAGRLLLSATARYLRREKWMGRELAFVEPPTLPPADECMYSDPLLMMTVAINGRFWSPPPIRP